MSIVLLSQMYSVNVPNPRFRASGQVAARPPKMLTNPNISLEIQEW